MNSNIFLFADLQQMPTLETDNRKFHLSPWYLKISKPTYRVWINDNGQLSLEVYKDGNFKTIKTRYGSIYMEE